MNKEHLYYRSHQPQNLDLLSQISKIAYVLMDLETTGFDPKIDQITQIGASKVNGSKLTTEGEPFNQKIRLNKKFMEILEEEAGRDTNPGYQSLHWVLAMNNYHSSLRYTGEKAMATLTRDDETTFEFEYDVVGKLTPEEMKAFKEDQKALPTEEKVLVEYCSWAGDQKASMVMGHNAYNFDVPFLKVRVGDKVDSDMCTLPVLDTMWLARLLLVPAIYALEDLGVEQAIVLRLKLEKKRGSFNLSSKLQDLRDAFKVDGGLAHDALGDIKTNLEVLKEIAQFLLKYQDKLSEDPQFIIYKNQVFNKHKVREFKY